MEPSDILTKETILAALRRLDELLREKGVIGEICIFGDAAMVLAFDARESTRDVDAVFVAKDHVLECARLVAAEFGIDDDWMNNGVKGFISNKAEVTHEGMPVFDNLRVMRPTTEYLLAMKCLASRVGPISDRADVITLLHLLKMYDSVAICNLVCQYYSERLLAPKVRFFSSKKSSRKSAHEHSFQT
jgi:hypothetical protein